MGAAVKAEFLKFFSTRMWWGMGIAVLASGLLFAALNAILMTSPEFVDQMAAAGMPPLNDVQLAKSVYTGGISVAYMLTLAIGVLAIGAEYRHKTISATFLATPRRARVMGAKVIALLGIGAFYGALSLLSSVALGASILSIRGRTPFPDASVWRTLALSLLVLGLWALIGLGVGILIPNQVAALMISVGVAFIVEPLLTLLLASFETGRSIVRFLPATATSATFEAGSSGPGVQMLSWWAGALVLAGYAAVMAGVGTALTLRRDVT